uniref:RING-type domain-containing protein n=1 Tax=Salix viminalis TaxID=40686 RepID=A0A6N2M4Y6_SALVM
MNPIFRFFLTMDITHDVRTCAAYLNYDCVPTGAFLGVNGGGKARYVNRDSQNCSQYRGTDSKLFRCRGSSFPDENQGKFYRMSSDNATEARTPDEVGVQNENIKAAETSQTESTSYSVAAMAKRSSSLKVQPGKPGRAHQLTQSYKYSAKAVDNNENPMRPVKKSGAKSLLSSGQVLWVNAKTKAPKYPSESSSSEWKVKEEKEPSKDPSNLSSNSRPSDQVHGAQPSQKSKCSADAVKKSRNQIQAVKKIGGRIPSTPKQEKQKQETSKGPSNLLTKTSSCDHARRGQPGQRSKCSAEAVENRRNQLPATPRQVWQVKRETLSSQGKGEISSKILQVKKKTSTLSSRTSSSHAKRQRHHRRQRSLSPEHHIKWNVLVKLGHSCFLCKNDLAHSPLLTEEESESESELESDKLPDVAVLPCGHAFHTLCLEQVISEYELKDPSCLICTSLQ